MMDAAVSLVLVVLGCPAAGGEGGFEGKEEERLVDDVIAGAPVLDGVGVPAFLTAGSL